MEAVWTAFTLAVVENAFPTDLKTVYNSWIDTNPGKAGRLAEIVAEVGKRFRAAVEAGSRGAVEGAAESVPTAGFGHALVLVFWTLGLEMGVTFGSDAIAASTRADIWLRMAGSGGVRVDADSSGWPTYQAPEGAGVLP